MTATWGDLFDRADAYDASVGAVRRALAERRAGTGGQEDGESGEPGDCEEGIDAPDGATDATDASSDDEPEGTNTDGEPAGDGPG